MPICASTGMTLKAHVPFKIAHIVLWYALAKKLYLCLFSLGCEFIVLRLPTAPTYPPPNTVLKLNFISMLFLLASKSIWLKYILKHVSAPLLNPSPETLLLRGRIKAALAECLGAPAMAQQLANSLAWLMADERIRGRAAQGEDGARQAVQLRNDVIFMDHVDDNILQRIVVDAKALRRQVHARSGDRDDRRQYLIARPYACGSSRRSAGS